MNSKYTPQQSPPLASIERIFGRRASDVTEFAHLHGNVEDIGPAMLTALFDQTGGRTTIAQSVIDGAKSLGIDLNGHDPDRLSELLPPQETITIQGPDGDAAAVWFLQLLSVHSSTNTTTISLAHQALIGKMGIGAPAAEDLVAELLHHGLLKIDCEGGDRYSIPFLIRTLARRLSFQSGFAEPFSPAQAFGRALQNSSRTLLSLGHVGLDELLALAVAVEEWDILCRIWSDFSFNVFTRNLESTVSSYLSVPETIIADSPILAEARSAAWEVRTAAERRHSTDPSTVLHHPTFELLDVPSLEVNAAALDNGDFSADEVIVMTLRSIRDHFQRGSVTNALEAADRGTRLTLARSSSSGAASRHFDTRLQFEHGVALAAAGHLDRALHKLGRSILVSESTLPGEPFPLQAAYPTYALVLIFASRGAESDEYLARYHELSSTVGFKSPQSRYTASTTSLFRALAQLDLASAARLIEEAQTDFTGFAQRSAFLLGEGTFHLYSGNGGKYLKRHAAEFDTVDWSRSGGSLVHDHLFNLVSMVYLAIDAPMAAQKLVARTNHRVPGRTLTKARLSLALGQLDEADALASRIIIRGRDARAKGIGHAIRGATELSRGRTGEALREFENALDFCVVTSSMMPLSLLPRDIRSEFVQLTATNALWDQLADTFTAVTVTATELQNRLDGLPDLLPMSEIPDRLLDPIETTLLFKIGSSMPVSLIASELDLAEGTVKNKLSAMYKKIGVRNRREAVDYGHRNGYFSKR